MRKISAAAIGLFFLLLVAFPVLGQRERVADQTAYTERFFEQLRNLFGRFREGDLRRAFEFAGPIRCSDLVGGNGEWHQVAFFNEDRRLGDWFHGSLAEVNGDLASYTFQGSCSNDQSSVQLLTKFPVKESQTRYVEGRIKFSDIKTTTNAGVRASFDSRSQAYVFELPYLYSVKGRTPRDIVYSLYADRADDRYVTNMIDQWECKSVRANDLTFQFLICDTWIEPRGLEPGSRSKQSFGAAAYFILSDGKEAATSIKLSFGDGNDEKPAEPVKTPAEGAPLGPLASWQSPDPAARISEVDKGEFRIRFNAQTWADKIGTPQVLANQKMSSFDAAKPPVGVDYCVWRPASASLAPRVLGSEPDKNVAYALTATDASMSFDMKTHTGSRLGTIQCLFPAADAATMAIDRWAAIAGEHLTIEVLP